MLLGYPLTTVYMTVLIVVGLLTLLYVLFADIADGLADGIPFFDLAIILPFITIGSAIGYILEVFTALSPFIVFIIALITSALLTAFLYTFLFVPLRRADVSLAYSDASLEGQAARVLTPIPLDGYGEILIEGVSGSISKRAKSFDETEIEYGTVVVIVEVIDGTAYVARSQTFDS